MSINLDVKCARWAPVMTPILGAVERHGWQRVETAAHVWAGRIRQDEAGCPALVAAWRRALADVVCDALAWRGVAGLELLATWVVREGEAFGDREQPLGVGVTRWSRLARALDLHSAVPSSFPQAVLSPADLRAITAVADELDEARRRQRAKATPLSEAS